MSSMRTPEGEYLKAFPDAQVPTSPDALPTGIDELIQQIKDTADKLHRDKASRGDVKLLATALRELRYSFKVFAGLHDRRKVTVFGSARIGPESPSYQQAVEFGRMIA